MMPAYYSATYADGSRAAFVAGIDHGALLAARALVPARGDLLSLTRDHDGPGPVAPVSCDLSPLGMRS